MTPKNQTTPLTSYMRRQEARRQRGEARGTLWQQVSRGADSRVLLIWAGFYVAAVAILFAWRESMPWRLMQRVDREIVARVDFTVTDPLKTSELRQEARAGVPLIYISNEIPLNALQGRLTELFEVARSADKAQIFSDEIAKRKWDLKNSKAEEVYGLLRDRYAAGDAGAAAWGGLVKRLIERLQSEPIVDQIDSSSRQTGHKSELRPTGKPTMEVATGALRVATVDSIQGAAAKSVQAVFGEQQLEPLRPVVEAAVLQSLVSNVGAPTTTYVPLWRYDASATTTAQRAAEQAILPVIHEFKADDKLVPAGSVLSVPQLDLLKSEHQAFLKAQSTDSILRQKRFRFEAGIAGIVLLITFGLACYASIYEGRTFQTLGRTLGLAILMLIMVGAARLIELAEWPYDLPVEFSVGLVTIAASLMAIAFGQRFALGSSTGLCVLVAMASRGDLGLFLTLLTAAGISIILLKEIRTRSKVIVVGSLAGLAAVIASVSVGFIAGEDVRYVLIHAAVAGFAALVAGFVVQGILPQFERIFGIATSMTLLEWCDAGRPLLRLLAQNAPGTYSHSIMISQMAEEAAEAVNARGLLARVGALYHDIGKVAKPDYYVENQEARINRHDRLSPTMSMLIILGHVKDGIEMARAYGLPRILHQFIAEHHGTTVARYFHRAACEAEARTKRFCDRDVPESEFRYPGPKPASKESAILMLCDGCEGAVRAISEPTPGRIESVVHQVIMDRLNDGQFDHCDITLRDLKIVERSLVKSLAGIHHGRIKYPEKVPTGRAANGEAEPKSSTANGHSNGYGNGNGNGGSQDRAEQPAANGADRTSEVVRQA